MFHLVIYLCQGLMFAFAWPGSCVPDQSILAGVCVPYDQAG